jgi:CheY-like chemotaxis protein
MSEPSRQLCVLIVEDEMALAMMLEDMLEDGGYRVLKAARLPAAVALAETAQIDAAILDINLGGTAVFPAADVLRRRGIPFVFTSGYGHNGLPPDYLHSPMLQKPYDGARLRQALEKLVGGGNDPVPG